MGTPAEGFLALVILGCIVVTLLWIGTMVAIWWMER